MSQSLELSEAIARHVHDGQTVALEGFTHLIPFAAGQEIIRQGRRDLTIARLTPDLIYDQMIGAGCVRKLIFSWGGNPGVGSLHRMRDAIQDGWPRPIEIEEHSHAGMAERWRAGAGLGRRGRTAPRHPPPGPRTPRRSAASPDRGAPSAAPAPRHLPGTPSAGLD